MINYKPYELIKIKKITINDRLYTDVDAYFIRLVKDDKAQVQINGTLIILELANIFKPMVSNE